VRTYATVRAGFGLQALWLTLFSTRLAFRPGPRGRAEARLLRAPV